MNKSQGFTIIELMIATTVFSVVLLICTFGVMHVTRYYYKGITSSRTQEAARAIIDEVGQSIQYSGGNVVYPITSVGNVKGFCIGNIRYSYMIDRQLVDGAPDAAKHQANHVFVADTVATCNSSTQALDLNDSSLNLGSLANAHELMGLNMRLGEFNISLRAGTSLYLINLKVVHGDDELLDVDRTACTLNLSGGQFCAVSTYQTTVLKRI